jgi:hypothetical protein
MWIQSFSSQNNFMNHKCTHHAEGLVDPKVLEKNRNLILDSPEHVYSENIKLNIGYRPYIY